MSAFQITEFGKKVINVGTRDAEMPSYGLKIKLTEIPVLWIPETRLRLFFS